MASIKMPLLVKLPLCRRRGCSVPAPGAVLPLGQGIAPAVVPGLPAPHGSGSGAGASLPRALQRAPALGPAAEPVEGPAAPCPGGQAWDGRFGGHNWLLSLSPGSSQVTLIAANLFNWQKYNRSVFPSVLEQEVVSGELEAGNWVPLVPHPPSETLGSLCPQPSGLRDAGPWPTGEAVRAGSSGSWLSLV